MSYVKCVKRVSRVKLDFRSVEFHKVVRPKVGLTLNDSRVTWNDASYCLSPDFSPTSLQASFYVASYCLS